jgi:hypothetical protein
MKNILLSLLLISSTLGSFNTFAQVELAKDDPLLDDSWITDQPTFNYRLPCEMDKINAVVIIIHGTNQLDLVDTNNEQGKPLYKADLSSTYPIMDKFCVITVIPKSKIIRELNLKDVNKMYRYWWMSEQNALGHKTDENEVEEIIKIIQLAKDVVKKPIFLAMGHDRGILQNKLISKMYSTELRFIDQITGFVDINYHTGEFVAQFFNGNIWLSEEH